MSISVGRITFVKQYLPHVNVSSLFEHFSKVESNNDVRQILSSFIRRCLRPKLETTLRRLATASREELGAELPNTLLSTCFLLSEVNDTVQSKLCDQDVVPSVFMEHLFTRSFTDLLEPLIVRSLKLHFVLLHSGQSRSCDSLDMDLADENGEFSGKIQEMVDEVGSFAPMTEFSRGCLVTAAHHIASKYVVDLCSTPKPSVKMANFHKMVTVLNEWLRRWSIYNPEWESSFKEYADKMLIAKLCEDAFDIFVADYPKTLSLLTELKHLMSKREWYGREKLLNTLCSSISERLLHVGIHTRDILKAYACAVESLIAFDESFVLVHKICDLIKKYVKGRPDTVRTIIHFITAEKPGRSSTRVAQLVDKENLVNVNDEYVIMLEDADKGRWEQWQPDPYDANPTESRLFRESADVFNMLVSIYGSRDMFVKEYQGLLANSLIAKGWGEHKDSEQGYLETMKKRFTDGELIHCEVMLRDIGESEKLFKHAVADGLRVPFFPRIISSVFWPESKKETEFKVVEPFKDFMDQYKGKFEKKKEKRTINWFRDYGSLVKMDVKIKEVTLSVEAPLSVTQVLLAFLEKDRYTVKELMANFEMEKSAVLKRLDFWREKGVLSSVKDSEEPTWEISQNLAQMERVATLSRGKVQLDEHPESDEEEEGEVPLEDQVDALEQFWMYTKNLLLFHCNRDPLTPARLVGMYKMFATPGSQPPTLEAVMMFMQRKIKQNLVIFENGYYKPDQGLQNPFS